MIIGPRKALRFIREGRTADSVERSFQGRLDTFESDFYSSVATGNYWLFTQPKTGTSFLCHVLAFYNSGDGDFDQIARNGVLRAGARGFAPPVGDAITYSRETGLPFVLQTHRPISGKPARVICCTRNPLDACLAAAHWYVYSRDREQELEKALLEQIDRFAATHRHQLDTSPDLWVLYENLIRSPVETIRSVLECLGKEVDQKRLEQAIEMAGADRLSAYEAKRGSAFLNHDGSLNRPNFIRSGQIGEARASLAESTIIFMTNELERRCISIDDAPFN